MKLLQIALHQLKLLHINAYFKLPHGCADLGSGLDCRTAPGKSNGYTAFYMALKTTGVPSVLPAIPMRKHSSPKSAHIRASTEKQ